MVKKCKECGSEKEMLTEDHDAPKRCICGKLKKNEESKEKKDNE